MTAKEYEYHPLANKFPRMAPNVFKAFKADIAAHGLDKPIELLDGMIFDGRHRYEACLEAGIEPRFIELAESTEGDSRVRAVNALRRHLTKEQVAEWLVEQRKDEPPQGVALKSPPKPSNRALAKETGIDRKTIDRAAAIDKKAAPEVKAAIASGDITRQDAAKILDKSPEVQAKAVEKVKAGAAPTVAAAIAGKQGKLTPAPRSIFKKAEDLAGKLERELDELHDTHPSRAQHGQAISAMHKLFEILALWKRVAK